MMALYSLSAVKCTITDNKTANINENCSSSSVLTSMDIKLQKIIKR